MMTLPTPKSFRARGLRLVEKGGWYLPLQPLDIDPALIDRAILRIKMLQGPDPYQITPETTILLYPGPRENWVADLRARMQERPGEVILIKLLDEEPPSPKPPIYHSLIPPNFQTTADSLRRHTR